METSTFFKAQTPIFCVPPTQNHWFPRGGPQNYRGRLEEMGVLMNVFHAKTPIFVLPNPIPGHQLGASKIIKKREKF